MNKRVVKMGMKSLRLKSYRVPAVFGSGVWIPFLMLKELGEIITSTKLQKLTFLIQVEGRLRGYRFIKYPYGPYSLRLNLDMFYANCFNLIMIDRKQGLMHEYYTYRLTHEGSEFTEMLLKKVSKDRKKRALEIIRKYGQMDYKKLMEYVYKWYVIPKAKFKVITENIRDISSVLKELWKRRLSENPQSISAVNALAIIEYIEKALEKAESKIEDQVVLGVCIMVARDLLGLLESRILDNKYYIIRELDPEINEVFDFFQYYCSEYGILAVIDELDFSEFLTEEEIEQLEEAFREAKPY